MFTKVSRSIPKLLSLFSLVLLLAGEFICISFVLINKEIIKIQEYVLVELSCGNIPVAMLRFRIC